VILVPTIRKLRSAAVASGVDGAVSTQVLPGLVVTADPLKLATPDVFTVIVNVEVAMVRVHVMLAVGSVATPETAAP
jgi:hypothetical protein